MYFKQKQKNEEQKNFELALGILKIAKENPEWIPAGMESVYEQGFLMLEKLEKRKQLEKETINEG